MTVSQISELEAPLWNGGLGQVESKEEGGRWEGGSLKEKDAGGQPLSVHWPVWSELQGGEGHE